MKEIPVGSHVCAIRQQIDGGKQITGILPQLIDPAGPTTVSEPVSYTHLTLPTN